jgi:hypothetical protein
MGFVPCMPRTLLGANAWSIVANELVAKLRPQTQNPQKALLCYNELFGYCPAAHITWPCHVAQEAGLGELCHELLFLANVTQ